MCIYIYITLVVIANVDKFSLGDPSDDILDELRHEYCHYAALSQ